MNVSCILRVGAQVAVEPMKCTRCGETIRKSDWYFAGNGKVPWLNGPLHQACAAKLLEAVRKVIP